MTSIALAQPFDAGPTNRSQANPAERVEGPLRDLPSSVVRIRPLRLALAIAAAYGGVGTAYILVSTMLADSLAASIGDMRNIELAKGILFVATTSALLFGFSSWLLERLRRQEEAAVEQRSILNAAERRAATGLLAAAVGHDLNNALMVNSTTLDRLTRAADLPSSALVLVTRLQRVHDELRGLSSQLARTSGVSLQGSLQDADVATLLRDAVDLARSHKKIQGCAVLIDVPASAPALVDPPLMRRAVFNLILNAAEATDGEGTIKVALRTVDGSLVLEVHDNGPGIRVADRARVLEPLYTTKPLGTGLGLLSARLCADTANGRVEIEDSPLGGACVRVAVGTVSNEAPSCPVHTACTVWR